MIRRDREQLTTPPDGGLLEDQPAWRQDFPIDWPQDHYVARRDFTKFLTLTSLAFVVGQFWIGVQNWFRRLRGKPPRKEIISVEEFRRRISVGEALPFRYPQEQ